MDWAGYIVVTFVVVIGLTLVAAIAFLPWEIARRRQHANTSLVALLCVLGLFTGIGWIIALLYALFGERNAALAAASVVPAGKRCPSCAEIIQQQAKVCRHCGHNFAARGVVDSTVESRPDLPEWRVEGTDENGRRLIVRLRASNEGEARQIAGRTLFEIHNVSGPNLTLRYAKPS